MRAVHESVPFVAAATLSLACLLAPPATAQPVHEVEQTAFAVAEDAGSFEFCVVRSGDLANRSDVFVSTADGTATSEFSSGGVDFGPLASGPVFFFTGEDRICFPILIFDDPDDEDDEFFTVFLHDPTEGVVGPNGTATVVILDDDHQGPPRVSLVALPSPEGVPVVFAPASCFDGQPDPVSRVFDVHAALDRTLAEEVCIDVGGPALDPDAPAQPCARVPAGRRFGSMPLRCRAQPPSSVALGSPLPAGLVPGTPTSAEVRPCELLVNGTLQPCEAVTDLCAVEAFFGQLCQGGYGALCDEPVFPAPGAAAAPHRSRRPAPGTAPGHPLETLRDLRDGPMSESPAGRYYRDLYAGYAPELRSLLLSDLRIPVDLLEVYPPWVDALGELVEGDGDQATMTPAMIGGLLRVLDRFEQSEDASAPLRALIAGERQRLGLGELSGQPIDSLVDRLEERGGPPPCAASDTALCLQGGRFLVEAHWTDFQGGSGVGHAVPLPSGSGPPDSGYFWFFNPSNVELVVKVLNGSTINGHFWVFYGALSNVAYTLTVTDTETGAVRVYRNPSGRFASVGDTRGFSPDGAPRGGTGTVAGRAGASLPGRLSVAAAETVRGAWRRLTGVVRGPAAEPASPLDLASGHVASRPLGGGTCVASPTALCLRDGRFRVEVEWEDFQGGSGPGRARPLTGDTGTFWFFNPANTELIVKLLDGRQVNGRFWFFYGALSNVAYTIRVTDTATGAFRTYENPAHTFGSRGDTTAF